MVDKPVVIVGGGIAGLSVAKSLTDSGVPCVLTEREASLGGQARNWACMATDQCQRCYCCLVEDLIADVSASELADVRTDSEVASVQWSEPLNGRVQFKAVGSGEETAIDASALVWATGMEPYNPAEKGMLGHGRLEGVYTLAEVDSFARRDKLAQFTDGIEEPRVAFFQCVGSRDSSIGADYCSQYCCKAALRMALKLIHEIPKITCTMFYIDLQIAGKFAGDLLKQAQDKNVRLVQGVPGEIVEKGDKVLQVIVERDGRNVREQFDRIILSIGQRPRTIDESVAEQSGVERNRFNFMAPKDDPEGSRTATPGVYVAGACVGPKNIEQTLEHAGQTASAVLADLRKGAQS